VTIPVKGSGFLHNPRTGYLNCQEVAGFWDQAHFEAANRPAWPTTWTVFTPEAGAKVAR
jgi:hypothetical protein